MGKYEKGELYQQLLRRGVPLKVVNNLWRAGRLDSMAELATDLTSPYPDMLNSRNIGNKAVEALREALTPEIEAARRGETLAPNPEPEAPSIEQRLLAALREFIREELRKEGADHE